MKERRILGTSTSHGHRAQRAAIHQRAECTGGKRAEESGEEEEEAARVAHHHDGTECAAAGDGALASVAAAVGCALRSRYITVPATETWTPRVIRVHSRACTLLYGTVQ
jgi:hypothetical protein